MALNPFARGSSSIFDPFSFPLYSWDPTSFSFPTLLNSDNISPSHGQMYRDAAAIANTQVDWKETPHAHVFKANLPGLKKEEIKVEVEDGCVLSISGKRSKEQKEETDVWHRVERSEGSFVRKFRLPENAKLEEEKMKAVVEDGVLTVTIPKVEKSKTKKESKVRSIKIE